MGIEPTTADVGRKVIYRDVGAAKIEEGVITSFNDNFVFVRYGANTTSQATARRDLEWAHRGPQDLALRRPYRGGRLVGTDFCPLPPDPALDRS